ncbi:hypothetical protein EBT25_00995 [bacterium]|jgi:Aspartyl/Asparaginyl beta-hydroxylase|nr:hypothetical protein [bacterium]
MFYQLAKDFKFTNEFNALRKPLIDEFLAQFPDFCEEQHVDQEHTNNRHKAKTVSLWKSAGNAAAGDAWKVEGLKYQDAKGIVYWGPKKDVYPTALNLIESFGAKCPIGTYSIIEAQSRIGKHTGIENRQSKYVRCHIPLIVPPGDIALQVNDVVIRWDDCFAFDNQQEHSAWNKTNFRRLIFMIDLEREVVGWPPV